MYIMWSNQIFVRILIIMALLLLLWHALISMLSGLHPLRHRRPLTFNQDPDVVIFRTASFHSYHKFMKSWCPKYFPSIHLRTTKMGASFFWRWSTFDCQIWPLHRCHLSAIACSFGCHHVIAVSFFGDECVSRAGIWNVEGVILHPTSA